MAYVRDTPIGRRIQDRYEQSARQKCSSINAQMNKDLSDVNVRMNKGLNEIKDKRKPAAGGWLAAGFAVSILTFAVYSATTFLVSFVIPPLFGCLAFIIGWGGSCAYVSSFNSENEQKRESIKKRAKADQDSIRAKAQDDQSKVMADAIAKTKAELEDYDKKVQAFYKNCRKDALDRMALYCLDRFEDAKKNAEISAGNAEQYVSFNFTYDVFMTGISFASNGQVLYNMDYDFKAARYRALSTEPECEGLASVLLKMMSSKLKQKYKSQHGQMKSWHEDAKVTIQFKIPNKRFIPATAMI